MIASKFDSILMLLSFLCCLVLITYTKNALDWKQLHLAAWCPRNLARRLGDLETVRLKDSETERQ